MKNWQDDYCDDCGKLKYGFLTTCTCDEKMTFFEAWQKAKDGDKIKSSDTPDSITKNVSVYLIWNICETKDFNQGWLFKKEWSVIPKRKTVEINIPEGAEKVRAYDKNGTSWLSDVKKITYER